MSPSNNENVLELLIRLGFVGQDKADEARATIKDLGKKSEDTGEQFKFMETKGREFHRLLGELNRLAPGTGELLRAAFHPESLGIIVLLVGVEALVEGFKSLGEASKEAEKQIKDAMTAATNATVEASETLTEYYASYRNLVDVVDEMKKSEEATLGLINNQYEAAKRVLEAKENAALLDAAGDPAKQKAIKEAFEGKKQGLERNEEQARIDQMKYDLAKFQGRSDELSAKADEAAEKRAHNAPILAADKARTEAAVAANPDDLQAQERLAGLNTGIKANDEEAAKAKEEYQKNTAAIKDLTEKLTAAESKLETERGADKYVGAIGKFIPHGGVEDTVAAAAVAVRDAQKGKMTEKDKQALQALRELSEMVGLNADNITGALSTTHDLLRTQSQEISLIRKRMAAIDTRGPGG